MYAIVEILGQQFKVEAGKNIFVHRMEGAECGSKVEFENVLLIDNKGKIAVGAPTVKVPKLWQKLFRTFVGDKVLVFTKTS